MSVSITEGPKAAVDEASYFGTGFLFLAGATGDANGSVAFANTGEPH